jgi:hypothetical protein
MAILVLVESSAGAIFYNINTELAYLSLEVGLTVTYSVLVTSRLLSMRGLMKQIMREYDSSTYDTIVLMVVESAMVYIAYAIVFIVSFGMHSYVSNLCFLSISHVQVSKRRPTMLSMYLMIACVRASPNCSSSSV